MAKSGFDAARFSDYPTRRVLEVYQPPQIDAMRGILRRRSREAGAYIPRSKLNTNSPTIAVPSIVDSITSSSTDPPPSYASQPAVPIDQVTSRRERYSTWPWYLPPPGWILHPSWDVFSHPPDWTSFIPNSSKALRNYPTPMQPSPRTLSEADFGPWLPPSRSNSLRRSASTQATPRSHHSGMPPSPPPGVDPSDVPGPSPFFARIPPDGPHEPRFVAYRKAQAEARMSFHSTIYFSRSDV